MILGETNEFLGNKTVTCPSFLFSPHISQLIEGKCLNSHNSVFHFPGAFIHLFIHSSIFHSPTYLINRYIYIKYIPCLSHYAM